MYAQGSAAKKTTKCGTTTKMQQTVPASSLHQPIRNCLLIQRRVANTRRHSEGLVHQALHQALQNLPVNNNHNKFF